MTGIMERNRTTRVALVAGLACVALAADASAQVAADQYSNLPPTVVLTGVCRDFRWRTETGGHPDFEYVPTSGYGHYVGIVADELDSDGKPVFRSQGYRVATEASDRNYRNIMTVTKPYIQSRTGDHPGSASSTTGGAVSTAANLAQWFRDVPGVNMSTSVPVTLVRQPNTNIYMFNDRTDPAYANRGGFFPVDGRLFGNSPGQNHNFGFTFELDTTFVYQRGTGQVFTFTGDDDVFVFIGGKLVVDIGGVHSAVSQSIDLDRLGHLENGRTYGLSLFFAERHTTQSNVRIETNLTLRSVDLPAVTALFD
jgi:fibro-slime domain-containing protein